MIRHSVVFKLKHRRNSAEEKGFLTASQKLALIPGVQNFESLKQTSKMNNFDFGLFMEFENQKIYQQYIDHPDHVQFVKQYWLMEVEDFLELDYEPLG